MAPKPVPDPHANSTGWNIAAALGLLAAAFLMERLAPTETEGATKRETKRDASGAGPTEEGRGRLAESPSEMPAKGWKTSCSASIPTSGTTGFSRWPPSMLQPRIGGQYENCRVESSAIRTLDPKRGPTVQHQHLFPDAETTSCTSSGPEVSRLVPDPVDLHRALGSSRTSLVEDTVSDSVLALTDSI
jgi:hypothetical protein